MASIFGRFRAPKDVLRDAVRGNLAAAHFSARIGTRCNEPHCEQGLRGFIPGLIVTAPKFDPDNRSDDPA